MLDFGDLRYRIQMFVGSLATGASQDRKCGKPREQAQPI